MGPVHPLLLIALLGVLVTTTPAFATPILWAGNGHSYERIDTAAPQTWYQARDAAAGRVFQGQVGYLATVTSQAEQDALIALLGGIDPLRHHWLGGFQPPGSAEPAGGWQWITGKPWEYTNWGTDEPNNSSERSTFPGEGEDGLEMHNSNVPWAAEQWNDLPRTSAVDLSYLGIPAGYVVEYNAPTSVPEPSTLLLLSSGLAGLGGIAWR